MNKIEKNLISNKKKCFIFDIDGCLADTDNIILSKAETYEMRKKQYEEALNKYQADMEVFRLRYKGFSEGKIKDCPIEPIRPKEPDKLKESDYHSFDWEYFNSHLGDAKPIWGVIDLFIQMAMTNKVILLTGRKESARITTIDWLKRVIEERAGKDVFRRISYSLIMREEKNNEPSGEFKKTKLVEIQKEHHIQLMIEDHPDVIEVLTKMGILALKPNTIWKQIGKGDMKPVTIEVEVLSKPVDVYIDTGVKENAEKIKSLIK